MKYLIIAFLMIAAHAEAQVSLQDQYHNADTLLYNGIQIKPGDTLNLGFGSGSDKQFVFISFYGGVMSAMQANMPAIYANHKILYDHMLHKGNGYYPVFYLDGKRKNNYRYLVDFGNAVAAKEILLK
jgi:hypothetical protein